MRRTWKSAARLRREYLSVAKSINVLSGRTRKLLARYRAQFPENPDRWNQLWEAGAKLDSAGDAILQAMHDWQGDGT